MADVVAEEIVNAALRLRRSHPSAPGLETLDLVMKGLSHSDPDFYTDSLPSGTWLVPPNAFASLLRDAFDSSLTDADLVEAGGGESGETSERWVAVVDRFARRYDLWRPGRML